MLYHITDWDDAYANGPHVPGSADYPDRWARDAAAFRETARLERLEGGDLFHPEGTPRGLAVFIHGGYWMKFDPSFWSHLAAGALARGWAVAMPGYRLAPKARIEAIGAEVARAVAEAAARVAGPIALSGHSAGGHLAARLICPGGLPEPVLARVSSCVPISGLADLRPLMRTAMNATLGLDSAECAAESPALLEPAAAPPVTAWVGGMERPEFIRQSRLLADAWAGLGLSTECVVDPGLHHFNVIDALTRRESPLVRRLLAAPGDLA